MQQYWQFDILLEKLLFILNQNEVFNCQNVAIKYFIETIYKFFSHLFRNILVLNVNLKNKNNHANGSFYLPLRVLSLEFPAF